ncbi:RES domain-containing protein [Massilia sp. CCM 8695]|uniref:RES domain-containing protein n=1 Tax=Massilia frigida TaxID=2609281 RepID=A0ABX0NHV8_9BURK|nr:RES family NAD+ phosphorylase [Massilia frigida]NHZ83031.1 RES domain-containing protein [Massilia frigida]
MTVSLWRIAVETASYSANDLSGTGAKKTGGRWNSTGTRVVYCATSIALAALETVHYLRGTGMPFNRYLVRVDIPDPVWAMRAVLDPLPGAWDAVPAGLSSRLAGDSWVASAVTALLEVPSVLVPEERNIVINPRHPDAAGIASTTLRRWIYDPRFFP